MFDFAMEYLPFLLAGVPITLAIWAIAIALGTLLGAMLAWAGLYLPRPIALASEAYIDVMRGTPMIIQMFFIYFGLPELGLVLNPFTAATAAIGLNSAAYQAVYFRSAVRSIPSSQLIAARSIGLGHWKAFRLVVVPQAWRNVLPAWSNELVMELQFSSIAFVIGVMELTGRAEKIGYMTFEFFNAFFLCGTIYAVLVGILVLGLARLRRSLGAPPMEMRA